MRSALKLGLPTVPHALAIYVVAAGDRILVERELGLPSVARYQVAYLVGALGLTLAGAFNNAWSTLVYGARDEDRWHVLADTTAELYRLVGFIVGVIAFGGPVVLGVLAPGDYRPLGLAPVCAVVAISVIPYIDYLANSHAIFYCRRAWSLAWMTPVAAAVNVAMNLLLLPHLGLIGAAYATVAGYLVQATLARAVRSRFLQVPWRADATRAAWVLGVACACAGALLPSRGVWLVLRAVLAGALLTGLVVQVRRTLTRTR
jgi:O-antigen/teichoic acid export membrane protein